MTIITEYRAREKKPKKKPHKNQKAKPPVSDGSMYGRSCCISATSLEEKGCNWGYVASHYPEFVSMWYVHGYVGGAGWLVACVSLRP